MQQRPLSIRSKTGTPCIKSDAIEVHRNIGPGLLESAYESAPGIERRKTLPAVYKGIPIGEFRLALLVEESAIVELTNVERMDPLFSAQPSSRRKMDDYQLVLLNNNSKLLRDGIRSVI